MNYLVIPDVHGRKFWEEPVKKALEEGDRHVVFLGDYVDPYPHEWYVDELGDDIDYRKEAIERLNAIIEIKRRNPEKVTLLIGNHDAGYCIGREICRTRHDYANERAIEKMFTTNRKFFSIAKRVLINNRDVVFSHAGFLKAWAELVFDEEELSKCDVVDLVNNAWLTDHYGILNALGMADVYRTGYGGKVASPIWSDIRAWENVSANDTYGFNIVGHTQLRDGPIGNDVIIDLDCRREFYIDENGKLTDSTGKIWKEL